MTFKKKSAAAAVCSDRLAAVAGVAAGGGASGEFGQSAGAARARPVEPDLSRMRPRGLDETAAERKQRLAAKTVNFSATILARLAILAAAGVYVFELYDTSGQIHRGFAMGMFAVIADLGRVILKAMEPGTR